MGISPIVKRTGEQFGNAPCNNPDPDSKNTVTNHKPVTGRHEKKKTKHTNNLVNIFIAAVLNILGI